MSIGSFSSVTKQREVHTKPCGHVSETGGHASSGGAVTTVHSSGMNFFWAFLNFILEIWCPTAFIVLLKEHFLKQSQANFHAVK